MLSSRNYESLKVTMDHTAQNNIPSHTKVEHLSLYKEDKKTSNGTK